MPRPNDLDSFPKSPAEAGRKGAKYYYPGIECEEGHNGLYYRSTKACVACTRQRAAEAQERKREEARNKSPRPPFYDLSPSWQPIIR